MIGTSQTSEGTGMQWFSREQVLAMAPDSAAARAAQTQAVLSRWSGLGHDDYTAWGECQGSGASQYRCQVALADVATRCSCPSRKLPCKHCLGLLLLLSAGDVPAGASPDWVVEWLAARLARAAHKPDSAGGMRAPVDPNAQQRRAASRDSKVDAGVAELRRWLADLVHGGLAAAQARPWLWWDQMARRMIDAQARGLAAGVRRLAEIAATGGLRPDWPDRMVDQIGTLYLLCKAWEHRDQLPQPTAEALRARLGYPTSTSTVLASGKRLTDTWAVLGQRQSDDGQLKTLQQWLYGQHSRTFVTYLAFAAGGQPVEPGLLPGRRSVATVAMYPGTVPHRVLIVDRQDGGQPLGRLPGAASWQDALSAVAEVLATDPWADVLPIAARGVTVLPPSARPADAAPGRPWLLRDAVGFIMPLAARPDVNWRLFALSAGRPVDVVGEWDGFTFRPTAAAAAGGSAELVS